MSACVHKDVETGLCDVYYDMDKDPNCCDAGDCPYDDEEWEWCDCQEYEV